MGTVPLRALLAVAESTLAMLRSIERDFDSSGESNLEWEIVAADMGSPMVLELDTAPKSDLEGVGNHTSRCAVRGLRALRESAVVPIGWEFDAVRAAHRTLKSAATKGLTVQFREEQGEWTPLDNAVFRNTQKLVEEHEVCHTEEGTVEGFLRILESGKHLRVAIEDAGHDCRVECRMPENLTETVRALWKKRVAVRGRLKINALNKPVAMDAHLVYPLDEPRCLSPKDFEGDHSIDITGGEGSVEYIRRQRDEED